MLLSPVDRPRGGSLATRVSGAEAVTNPYSAIDIVVNVPEDYPGTFLDFKEELTDKLKKKGLDESKFRIISSAIKINTTDTSGWYVYDHYNNQNCYNNLVTDTTKQPFRQADNGNQATSSIDIADMLGNTTIEQNKKQNGGKVGDTCASFERHIAASEDAAGKASMTFVGYPVKPFADFMIYPASSDARRTFSFDIYANRVDTHTLEGAGFFMNAGVSNGKLTGYLLFYQFTSQTAGNIYLLKVGNVNANNFQTSDITSLYNGATCIKKDTFTLPNSKKMRIDVDLQSTSVTVQQREYADNGTFQGNHKKLFDNSSVSIESTGYNGFGPMAAYKSHSCKSLSSFEFVDLEMDYNSGAFDCLRNIQYLEDAAYKYFVNLVGPSGDSAIPDHEEGYMEGVRRLRDNKIFYLSNVNDGKVLTEPTETTSGVGPDNGLYATNEDYVDQMADYITDNYNSKVQYKNVDFKQEVQKPIANFIIVDKDNEKQVISVHLKHLEDTDETTTIKIKDKSQTAPDGKKITAWRSKVYDTRGQIVADSNGFQNNVNSLPTYTFNKDSKQGRYTLELTVKDEANRESTTYQTFLTAYSDKEVPIIDGDSLGKSSEAKITLTDNGWGIERDAITLNEHQGSGIAKYQVNDNEPVTIANPGHTYTFNTKLNENQLKITTWDECGNKAEKTFPTAKISFKNNEKEPYYVFKDKPLGELPPEPDKTDENKNKYFKGWADEEEKIVSSQTPVTKDTVLHPVYTDKTVKITYNTDGGKFDDGNASKEKTVPQGSKVIDNIIPDIPKKEGYEFTGWKIDGSDITDSQSAEKDTTVTATYKKASYPLTFDANGGALGKLKSLVVTYDEKIKPKTENNAANNPYTGNDLPTREGYKFKGWAKDKNGTEIGENDTMPAGGYTVYANWDKDETKYIVSFDSNGGSKIGDKSYTKNTDTKYGQLPTPTKAGYTFKGWFDDRGIQRTSNGDVYSQADHTLKAQWEANTNTQYKVEYYLKGDNGYTRDDSKTKTKHATTDTEVKLDDVDIITIDGYWYDKDNTDNVRIIKVGGDGKTALKLYYKRNFDINGTADGAGDVNTSGTVKEGGKAYAEWKPKDGYVVNLVTVDGIPRYDLVDQERIDWDNVDKNHEVSVKFTEKTNNDDPQARGTGYHQIRTKVNGVKNSLDITQTQTKKEGDNHSVNWQVKDGYYITSVNVDGKEYHPDTTSFDFNDIREAHDVTITTKAHTGTKGDVTKGNYTITVTRHGGNETDTLVSGSCVAEAGDNKDVTWSAKGGWRVVKVLVDGKQISIAKKVSVMADTDEDGLYNFANIQANHVVDVYFAKEGESVDFSDKDRFVVSSQLIGGPGTITGNAILDKGSNHTVTWKPTLKTSENPEDTNYAVYKISSVKLNGEDITKTVTDNTYKFENISKNEDLKVYMAPVTNNVNVLAYGNGTATSSTTAFTGKTTKVEATPDEGNKVVKLVIDGKEVDLTQTTPTSEIDDVVIDKAGEDKVEISVKSNTDHTIEVYFIESEKTKEDLPEETDQAKITANIVGGTGTVDGTGIVNKGENKTVTWKLDEGYELLEVKVNGETKTVEGNSITLENIQEESKIEILVEKRISGDLDVPGSNDNDLLTHEILTELVGGPGFITSSARVLSGDDHTVAWENAGEEHSIVDIQVDGVSRDDLVGAARRGAISFNNIDRDHKVKVVLAKVVAAAETEPKASEPEDLSKLNADVKTADATDIAPSVAVFAAAMAGLAAAIAGYRRSVRKR